MAEPVYCEVETIKSELSGSAETTIPETLTDERIQGWINERSREIDLRLPNYAKFPDIAVTPAVGPPRVYGTPLIIQRICRLLVAADCLRFIGLDRHHETAKDLTREPAMYDLLDALADRSLEIDPQEYDYSQASGRVQREGADAHSAGSFYITRLGCGNDRPEY